MRTNSIKIVSVLVLFVFTLASCASTQATASEDGPQKTVLEQTIDTGAGSGTVVESATPGSSVEDAKSETKEKKTILEKNQYPGNSMVTCFKNKAGEEICSESFIPSPPPEKDDGLSPWWIVGGVVLAGAIAAGICAAAGCFDPVNNVTSSYWDNQ